jgi:hypothetical protein
MRVPRESDQARKNALDRVGDLGGTLLVRSEVIERGERLSSDTGSTPESM